MEVKRESKQSINKYMKVGSFKFEEVESFKYLGVIINNKNEKKQEIDQRIQAGHRAYYKYKNIMTDKKISRNTKLRVNKTAIRTIVIYGAETMSLTKFDEEKMKIFERKIIRRIYGLKKIVEGEYRRLMNIEIKYISNQEDIIKIIKIQRLRWYAHIKRMGNDKEVKKITI